VAQINENKALSKAKRWAPYGKPGIPSKCKVCKSSLHQEGIYCQSCAYQKGLCSMCGKQASRAGVCVCSLCCMCVSVAGAPCAASR
jgi:hypothetical protein